MSALTKPVQEGNKGRHALGRARCAMWQSVRSRAGTGHIDSQPPGQRQRLLDLDLHIASHGHLTPQLHFTCHSAATAAQAHDPYASKSSNACIACTCQGMRQSRQNIVIEITLLKAPSLPSSGGLPCLLCLIRSACRGHATRRLARNMAQGACLSMLPKGSHLEQYRWACQEQALN